MRGGRIVLTTIFTVMAAAGIPTGTAHAAAWHTEGQKHMSRSEFRNHLAETGAFERYDLDADGTLERQEVARAAFETWDTSRNGRVDDEEFGRPTARWSDIAFADWDTDVDGELDRPEFAAGWEETGWFDSWDGNGNGSIDASEFAVRAYEALDVNGDQAVDEPEHALMEDGLGWMF